MDAQTTPPTPVASNSAPLADPPAPGVEIETTYPAGYNFALASHGATATGGRNPERLIDGDLHYSSGSGFATATLNPPQPFVITLPQPVKLNCIRFLLWDLSEQRYYRYTLEANFDGHPDHWATVAEHSKDDSECRGWQDLHFDLRIVKQIRLTGTFNSMNSFFHVVELEAYRDAPALKITPSLLADPTTPKRVDDPEF